LGGEEQIKPEWGKAKLHLKNKTANRLISKKGGDEGTAFLAKGIGDKW